MSVILIPRKSEDTLTIVDSSRLTFYEVTSWDIKVIIVLWVLFLVTSVFVLLRLYSRVKILQFYAAEDYLYNLAFVSVIGFFALSFFFVLSLFFFSSSVVYLITHYSRTTRPLHFIPLWFEGLGLFCQASPLPAPPSRADPSLQAHKRHRFRSLVPCTQASKPCSRTEDDWDQPITLNSHHRNHRPIPRSPSTTPPHDSREHPEKEDYTLESNIDCF